MHTKQTVRPKAAALALAIATLAACGGGESTEPMQAQDAKRRALATPAAVPDATALFNWAERSFPALFPAGPQNQSVTVDGKTYTIRHYAGTQNYLGVSGDEIYGLGPFTGNMLQSFGRLGDWSCEVLGQTCLSGTVASATAWAGAMVEARCLSASGSTVVTASATTTADGRYTLAVEAASLPCVVRATAADGAVLHSVAAGSGSGSRSTVHITPMTDLTGAYFSGFTPAGAYAGFSAAAAPQLTASAMQTAASAVLQTIKTAGVDFTQSSDFFGAALQPGSTGNAYGQALAQLADRQTHNIPQARLVDAILRTRPDAKAAGTPSLPADLLLRPAAANCAGLRSGTYRVLLSDPDEPHATVTIDAPALTLTGSDGTSWSIEADGKCRFKEAAGSEYAVTDAGIVVSRLETENRIFRAAVMFPEQPITVAEVAGSWNGLSLEDASADGEGYIHSMTQTFGSDGRLSALTYCGKDAGKVASDCVSVNNAAEGLPDVRFSTNADGGLTLTNTTDGWTGRSFFYRTGSGDLLYAEGGHLTLSTAKRSVELQAVGSMSEGWQAAIATNYTVSSAMTPFKSTVRSQDATNGLILRDAVIDFTTGVTRPERIESNRFREGYRHRIAETVTASNGSSVNVGEWLALTLRGTGLTAVGVLTGTQSYILAAQASTAP